MTYLDDLHSYLHHSSLLIQAYPSTRITTKYSLPRKPNTKARSKPKDATVPTTDTAAAASQSKREPSAVLTLKTYHPDSGICLKYRTDKAAEVGRLLGGLGRLAKGEIIEMPATSPAQIGSTTTAAEGDKMEVDSGMSAPKAEDKVVMAPPAVTQTGGGGGGKGKKKKGKK
ncbi:hypothetical protein A1O1_02899 [Capronia coronata CBS 617.96]|uniref:SRP9 domain-containing protein n=1 Tax=Capronia coronata CBS 617.96 TaxID=1182541 RepID=W9YPM9_9EURO|nr:uncharacterized protein A1O1_02899 [Capronia coronata CBS 617.96]EXJ94503.1 hypothetical protein A1O1_02899 [Capronia coronata CBS 617.96]